MGLKGTVRASWPPRDTAELDRLGNKWRIPGELYPRTFQLVWHVAQRRLVYHRPLAPGLLLRSFLAACWCVLLPCAQWKPLLPGCASGAPSRQSLANLWFSGESGGRLHPPAPASVQMSRSG